MIPRFVPRTPILRSPTQPGLAGLVAANPHAAAARAAYLQGARDPSQPRRVFQRPGALDVK